MITEIEPAFWDTVFAFVTDGVASPADLHAWGIIDRTELHLVEVWELIR